eukprot:Gb_30187 [translate_table: standard]
MHNSTRVHLVYFFHIYIPCLCWQQCFQCTSFIHNHSCGSCGYPLNLSSSNRNTSNIGLKYCKAIKKGIISFLSIDESRFTQVDEFKCWPYFVTKHSWGLLRPRTKLLCGKCGMFIGHGYEDSTVSCGSDSSDSSSGSGTPGCRKYSVKIRSLQPSDDTNGPFLT